MKDAQRSHQRRLKRQVRYACMQISATALESKAQATRLSHEDVEHLELVTSTPGYSPSFSSSRKKFASHTYAE
jgi:hypothetical protein